MANRREQEKRQKKVVSAKKWASEHESGFSRTSLKIPDGVTMFNIKKAGTYRLDVIPYTVGDGNPHSDAGELHYERTYWVHPRIGPNGDTYCCSAKTFGKPCPVCEARAELARDPSSDDKTVKALFPKERTLWNVFHHTEPEKGVQVWDVSDHLFGKHLRNKINNADESDGYELFADPSEGSTLKIGATEEKGAGMTWRECSDIEFKARKEPISDELLEAATCLDDMPIEMDYDDLKEVFEGRRDVKKDAKAVDPDDDDDEPKEDSDLEPVAKKPASKHVNPSVEMGLELGMKVLYEPAGICEITKISPDGTSLILEDEDGEMHTSVGPEEVELLKGKAKPSTKASKNGDPDEDEDDEPEEPSETEDEDDEPEDKEDPDEDEDDDDDEPPPPKKKTVSKPVVKPGKRK